MNTPVDPEQVAGGPDPDESGRDRLSDGGGPRPAEDDSRAHRPAGYDVASAAESEPGDARADGGRGVDTGPASPAEPIGEEIQALNHRGVALARTGRHEEAADYYRRAIEARPDYAEAHNHLGITLRRLGRHDEAIASYEAALRAKPGYAEAHNNLGIALAHQARMDEAIAHFEAALRARPDYPEAHNNLANVLRGVGRLDEAMARYRRALELRPDYPEAHNNLGNTLSEADRHAEAVACYSEAIRINYRYAEAHNNLGNALGKLGRWEEAQASYQKALWHNPDYAEAYNNLGNNLADQGRLAEAVACYRQALKINPDYAEAYNNLGITLGKQGKHAEAEGCYREALRLKPDYPDAHLNRALGWLIVGNFEQGWPEYEWRWRCRNVKSMDSPMPRWNGEPLSGRTVLVYYEQGLGDTLQFVRYAPLIKRRGGVVVLECQPALVPLLTRCAGIDRLIPRGAPRPEYHAHVALVGLPRVFRTTLATVPAETPYLYADPGLVARWRRELGEARGYRVGINWQGNPHYKGDRHRSIPLAQFAPIADLPGVELIALQKHLGTEQIATFAEDHPITDLGGRLDEAGGAFMDTAAMIMNLDLVITSDTALAHLAGGLGVPTWMPLSCASDWRWLLRREDSPWYPTMRLYRQAEPGNWRGVFERMASDLRPLVEAPPRGRPVAVEIGAGELIDKITILEIKAERIGDEAKLRNVHAELAALQAAYARAVDPREDLAGTAAELKEINLRLWDAEEAIRARERAGDFGDEFVALARLIRRENDRRAAIKRRINDRLGSRLVEEKSYGD